MTIILEARDTTLIPLAHCEISPLNPRASVTPDEIEALAASIRTVGLMQNLAGLRRADDRVEIVAGGRRLRALAVIAEQDGKQVADVLVPMIVTEDEAEARMWALSENTARVALHPADEIAAYRAMAASGSTVVDIAKAFAVTERQVKGRLRLARLAEPILDALRADTITLDIAAAYTVSDDATAQLAVFEQVKAAGWYNTPSEIRTRLTRETEDATGKLARYVGREAYEAAGGDVREDLFGEDVWFLDTELLTRLATEKLETAQAKHLAEGWKWAGISLTRPDYEALSPLAQTYPQQTEATEEEAARYDALADLIETGAASEADEQEFAALEVKLDREVYTDAQKAHAGVFLSIGYDGGLDQLAGYIAKEDREAAEAAGICRAAVHPARESKTERKGPYSAALSADLAEVRTGALQTALLDHSDLALDLLTFALATPVYCNALPLGITTEDAPNAPKGDDGMRLPKALRALDERTMPLRADQATEAFAAFQRKKPATKAKLLTETVARLLRIGLAGGDVNPTANPFAEMISELAGLDTRRVWTPPESFLKRLKKDQLLAIHQHIMDRPEPSTSLARQSKKDIAHWLHLIFNGGKQAPTLTEAQRARADSWLPEGMAAPAVRSVEAERDAA